MSFSVSSFVTNAITITIIVTRSLVNWCFEPSQPLGIVSGLKETMKKRYTVERTNKAEVRPEEQSEKAASCRERCTLSLHPRALYGMKYSRKGHKDRNRHKNGIKRSGQARLINVEDINRNVPTK